MERNRHLLVLVVIVLSFSTLRGGDWTTVGGSSLRNGISDEVGPNAPTVFWITPSPSSIWGNQIFAFGNKFATTRYTSLSPVRAIIACHDLTTGDTLWTRNYAPNGVMVMIGFNNNTIYARNFQQQGFDTIYAINPDNGSVLWQSRWTVERGIVWSAAFASNGDLILPGSGSRSLMRINRATGDTVWTRQRTIPNTGAECICVAGGVMYTWEGGITTPKRIMGLSVTTGQPLFYSAGLPGDGDQEIPFVVGPPGSTVYCIRDGGSLHALLDVDTGFVELWRRPIAGPVGTYSQFALGIDTSLYVPNGKKVYRLDYRTGAARDSSEDLVGTGNTNLRIAVGADGKVYVGNGASAPSEGRYFCFSPHLQTLWSIPKPYNYYSGPALARNGILLLCGSGSEITAYRTQGPNEVAGGGAHIANLDLAQNFPNPFNPSTVIRFQLPASGFVRLAVFDMLGREVRRLVDGELPGGAHQVMFHADGLATGVYYYRIDAEKNSQARKLLLLR